MRLDAEALERVGKALGILAHLRRGVHAALASRRQQGDRREDILRLPGLLRLRDDKFLCVPSYYGLEDEIDVYMGTFSKSLASLGGYMASSKFIADYVRHNSRPFIFALSCHCLSCLEGRFTEMTEIQAKTIPLLLEGKDVIGKSNTGTGKTAAFSIPIIEQIPKDAEPFVYALILCPTRELAMQACEEIGKFAKFKRWVKPVAVYGGASMERQIHALKNGANIVVGTPGRVLDHLRRRTLKLEHLRTIVLDEADEMLNMGFREDIESALYLDDME